VLFWEILRVALDAIRANKMRSLLTMLGIVIGVGAVITMVALGEGAQRQVEAQIAQLGTNVLSVGPGQSMMGGIRGGGDARLTVQDAEKLAAAPEVLSIAPEMRGQVQAQFGSNNANLRVMGTTPNYARVNNYTLELGRFFDESENSGRKRVVVLGGAIPPLLGTDATSIVGRTVSLKNVTFEVVGVLEEKGGSRGWFNEDEQVYIPLETAQFRLLGTDRLGGVKVIVRDREAITMAMAQMEDILRREHRIPMGRENDFWISDSQQFLAVGQETTQTFSMLLAGIAGVSLLVGGIGIMNIMLVSVTERTKEIGVRKALGATRNAVLLQFLLEATTLCTAGGLLGVGAAFGASKLLSNFANWTMAIAPESVGMAVAFAAIVGIFFGLWPARRAASLDPIVALRYE
jgi:putative ABC transport system permease protein